MHLSERKMTDSMNFGPEWLRNLSSDGSTGGGSGGGTRCQLADHRYGREEMLALFEKGSRPPPSLSGFPPLFSEQPLPPLALIPQADEERLWQTRPIPPGAALRGGRGGSLERGGRITRGRAPYQSYGRIPYEGGPGGGWGNAEPTEWSPRKDYGPRATSVDNWRRNRTLEEEEGWRSNPNHARGTTPTEKWGRMPSWRDNADGPEERQAGGDRANRASWQEGSRVLPQRRTWDAEDQLPEWAMENPSESGGTFDSSGAFHGLDDEQRDHSRGGNPNRREVPLQKSMSQQHMVNRSHPETLQTSLSVTSLSKPSDSLKQTDETQCPIQPSRDKQHGTLSKTGQSVTNETKNSNSNPRDLNKQAGIAEFRVRRPKLLDGNPSLLNNAMDVSNGQFTQNINSNSHRVEEDFDRLQEDLVKKLVVDEDAPRPAAADGFNMPGVPSATLPPPNLAPPAQDKWYYQDPQGDMQGPFSAAEMAEWFNAAYFNYSLLVKRQCDDSFYRLGDLVQTFGGNPFLPGVAQRIPPLKQEAAAPDNSELLQYQLLQRQLALRQAASLRAMGGAEPWSALSGMQQQQQQRELLGQQVLGHPQLTPDLQYLQQQSASNPLVNMLLHQMQQANKLPGPALNDKAPTAAAAAAPPRLDPLQALVKQMGGLQSLQNAAQTPHVGLPSGIAGNAGLPLGSNLPAAGVGPLSNSFPNLPLGSGLPTVNSASALPGAGVLPGLGAAVPGGAGLVSAGGIPSHLQPRLGGTLNDNSALPRPNALGAADAHSSVPENNPLKDLIRQLQNTPQMDALWSQNQFVANSQAKPQWQQSKEAPISMWDLPPSQTPGSRPTSLPSDASLALEHLNQTTTQNQTGAQDKEKELQQKQLKEAEREQKKKREQEEKQARKETDEKRKEEQRRQEAERRAAEEKRKKEEERMKKEMEKAKREAEEKRLRELEEKRRLKEQRKAEEEARKLTEEQRRLDEIEREKREARERDDQSRKVEAPVPARVPRAAPWSQASPGAGASLAEIQETERKKRAEQAAVLQQQRAQQMLQEQQVVVDRAASMQFNWGKKLAEQRNVKSLMEIQQEEQARMKQIEARLAASQKEKETIAPPPVPATPWSGQTLSWANTASQWNSIQGGFWEEVPVQKSPTKPSVVTKSNSTSAVNNTNKQPSKTKSKTKKEEQHIIKLFSNGPNTDQFMDWCTKVLSDIDTTVDIPTFIGFLRDVESATDVREYCREYLGEGPSTTNFATQFLEKRRLMRPNSGSHKDDLSSPAPAITPSVQHSNEFQEVKGKGKKVKKSKMMKVDARILGFSVTAAPDRLNVGDRDYVE